MIHCDEWEKGVHACVQKEVMIKYTVKNIVVPEVEAKVNEGFIDIIDGNNESEPKQYDISGAIIKGGESIIGNRDVELDLCNIDEIIGIHITKGVAGGENKLVEECEEANDFIQIMSPEREPPTQVPTTKVTDNAPSCSKGKGKGAYASHKGTGKGSKSHKSTGKGSKSHKSTGKGSKSHNSTGKGSKSHKSTVKGSKSHKSTNKGTKSHKSINKGSKSQKSTSKGSKSHKSTGKGGNGRDYYDYVCSDGKMASALPILPTTNCARTGNIYLTEPVSKTCKECLHLMNISTNEPRGRSKDMIYYRMMITSTTTGALVENRDIEDAILEVMNGYFKAALLGCGVDDNIRRQLNVIMLGLTSANFDALNIGGRGGRGETRLIS